MPEATAVRRCTVDHVFGTLEGSMSAKHYQVVTEASLAVWPTTSGATLQPLVLAKPSGDNEVNGHHMR